MIKKYLHTRLRVSDMDQSLRFYTRILGLKLIERKTSPRGSELAVMQSLVTGATGFIGSHVAEILKARGHQVVPAGRPIGGGQAIWIDRPEGVLTGGSEPRKDGCAIGY